MSDDEEEDASMPDDEDEENADDAFEDLSAPRREIEDIGDCDEVSDDEEGADRDEGADHEPPDAAAAARRHEHDLARWISRQRQAYCRYRLSTERIARLNQLSEWRWPLIRNLEMDIVWGATFQRLLHWPHHRLNPKHEPYVRETGGSAYEKYLAMWERMNLAAFMNRRFPRKRLRYKTRQNRLPGCQYRGVVVLPMSNTRARRWAAYRRKVHGRMHNTGEFHRFLRMLDRSERAVGNEHQSDRNTDELVRQRMQLCIDTVPPLNEMWGRPVDSLPQPPQFPATLVHRKIMEKGAAAHVARCTDPNRHVPVNDPGSPAPPSPVARDRPVRVGGDRAAPPAGHH
jgi:hypothetical protein